MISVWFTSSPIYGPECLLRIPRYVNAWDGSYRGFRAVMFGDLESLQRLLAEGTCTPNDFFADNDSLLLVRMFRLTVGNGY